MDMGFGHLGAPARLPERGTQGKSPLAPQPHIARLVVYDLSCGPGAAQLQLMRLSSDISASQLSD